MIRRNNNIYGTSLNTSSNVSAISYPCGDSVVLFSNIMKNPDRKLIGLLLLSDYTSRELLATAKYIAHQRSLWPWENPSNPGRHHYSMFRITISRKGRLRNLIDFILILKESVITSVKVVFLI
jgi:hypothetical protein